MKKLCMTLCALVLALSGLCAACAGSQAPSPAPSAAQTPTTGTDAASPTPLAAGELTESETLSGVTFRRSPYLEDQGLPPVEDCLPKTPKLANEMKPEQYEGGAMAIGQYGGTLRMSFTSTNWNPDIFIGLNEALMWSPSLLGESVHPNIVERVEVSADNKAFTFYLREGLKWSDGMPVTIEDFRFAIEDVMFNTELNVNGPGATYRDGTKPDGDPFSVEWLDDWSFRMTFQEPNGHFLLLQAYKGWIGYTDLLKPAHYLKAYHRSYGQLEEMKAEAERLGLNWSDDADWVNLFNAKDVTNWELCQEPSEGFPCLYPWTITRFDANGGATYVRNPYYFKVDAAGQQLPYIDEIKFSYFADQELYTLSMISGEQDFVRESATMRNIALYKENEANGFTVRMFPQHLDQVCFFFNLTYGYEAAEGTAERNYFNMVNERDFRRAMCKAINGPEVVDTIYYGYADEALLTPDNHDLEGAKMLFDELGYRQGNDGWRCYPDGTRIQAYLEYAPTTSAEWSDLAELVTQNWQQANIKFQAKSVDSALLDTRINANENQMRMAWIHVPFFPSGTQYDYYLGFGRLYMTWLDTGGVDGAEPPDWMKEAIQCTADIGAASVGSAESEASYNRLLEILREEIPIIEIGSYFKQPMLFNSNLRNIPIDGFAIACNFALETLYYENPG